MNKIITSNKIELIIENCPINQSAEADGFTGDFYQTFIECPLTPSSGIDSPGNWTLSLKTSALVTKDTKSITSPSAKFYGYNSSVGYATFLKSLTVCYRASQVVQ